MLRHVKSRADEKLKTEEESRAAAQRSASAAVPSTPKKEEEPKKEEPPAKKEDAVPSTPVPATPTISAPTTPRAAEKAKADATIQTLKKVGEVSCGGAMRPSKLLSACLSCM